MRGSVEEPVARVGDDGENVCDGLRGGVDGEAGVEDIGVGGGGGGELGEGLALRFVVDGAREVDGDGDGEGAGG